MQQNLFKINLTLNKFQEYMIQDTGAVLLSFVIEMQVMADKSHAGVLSLDLLIFWGMT